MERTGKRFDTLLLLVLLVCYCPLASRSRPDRQLLECNKESSKANRTNSKCLPNTRPPPDGKIPRSESSVDHDATSSETKIISSDFNDIVKRTPDEEAEPNCTRSTHSDFTDHSADVICQPNAADVSTNRSNEMPNKNIEVTIVPVGGYSDSSQVVRNIEVGSTNIIQCRFNLIQDQSSNLDLRFELRWLRSVDSSQGYQNHSISADGEQTITITTEDKRSWTVQRPGGLDLFINDFKFLDEGDYFCQALTLDKSKDSRSDEPTILDEKRIHLVAIREAPASPRARPLDQLDSENSLNRDTDAYSQENLRKLLPSLQVVPEYSELAPGERVQLACVTRDLDPDPDPERIRWTFEPFERPGFKSAFASRLPVNADMDPLPANTTQMGNILVIWSMSHETVGLFKCTYQMDNFNLTVEAAGELTLRPSAGSAPLVFVTPELLRVSANGSASIQCETTGYPPPKVEWYRIDVPADSKLKINDNDSLINRSKSLSIEHLEGIEVKELSSRDAMTFCEQSGCLAINNNRLQGKTSEVLVTGLSLINILQARAQHQGQYVCIASNKHGQNQASTLVDVEFKEATRVRIGDEYKQQTIVLESAGFGQAPKMQSATFKCSVEAGQPTPRLKWLRTTSNGPFKIKSGKAGGANYLIDKELLSKTIHSKYGASTSEMDIFDLTRVSSATSKVSTRSENFNKTLVLHLSTISVDDEGDYVCVGENELGRHSALARLIVRRPAHVSILQTSPHTFRPNDSFQLDCLASGHPAPLDIEWSRSDRGAFFALISHQSTSASGTGSPVTNGAQERAVLKFDRVTDDDAGEYTCAARDPLNSSVILSDTIMLMLEDDDKNSATNRWSAHTLSNAQRQLPKLMIRPTKVSAEAGSNITLDCLAISGLQPTVVEWLPPATMSGSLANVSIKPYYRSGAQSETNARTLLQLGSKLRITNVSKAHEGVYQCKGSNKIGVENAPALIKVVDQSLVQTDSVLSNQDSPLNVSSRQTETKTKIAKLGSNIELRCQVNGMVEQPATSWSRDGRELPASSVQIEHNLWIQNLSKSDEGLYLCSARSSEPNQIIQAKINLLVRGSLSWTNDEQLGGQGLKHDPRSVSAKIVASKSNPNLGDSITLECIISFFNRVREENGGVNAHTPSELEELERQVVWTNLHSGQSLFQDNVYIQNNLLIIYDLRQENAATYRCHFNDLLQHTDYKLLTSSVAGVDSDRLANFPVTNDGKKAEQAREILDIDDRRVKEVRFPTGARLALDCPSSSVTSDEKFFWTRGNGASWSVGKKRRPVGRESQQLIIESLDTNDADLYQCNRILAGTNGTSQTKISDYFLIQVETVAARFVQRPVSFITLPAVKDADYQLELEMKFFPEQAEGLLLFSGGFSGTSSTNNSTLMSANKRNNLNSLNQPDYISLGLVRGQLEFKFELGDGTTVLRSLQQVELRQWHRVLIERNRRAATMWLDGQAPVSNSSPGKFFNLNLDSLLYVGGHQVFLTSFAGNKTRKPLYNHDGTSSATQTQTTGAAKGNFYGFLQGFQGCIGSLQINGRELGLMARNRGVSMGIFECDKPECGQANCSAPQGSCQVDRSSKLNNLDATSVDRQEVKRRQSLPDADLRCICLPPFHGPHCNQTFNSSEAKGFLELSSTNVVGASKSPEVYQGPPTPNLPQLSECEQLFGVSQKRCSANGTSQCQPLSSSLFKCHCKLGFGGELCEHQVNFTSYTSVWFNQQAYVHFALKSPAKAQESMTALGGLSTFNETDFGRLTTFTDQLNVSLRVQTCSSYGLLFYNGPVPESSQRSAAGTAAGGYRQVSKSVLANLLARLSSGGNKVADYLALSLADGHAELSFELGSGVAVLRSTRRLNDGHWHQIEVTRSDLRINSLGPIALTHTDQLSHLNGLRNLLPCKSLGQLLEPVQDSASRPTSSPADFMNATSAPATLKPSRKPTKAPVSADGDGDDPDELAAAGAA